MKIDYSSHFKKAYRKRIAQNQELQSLFENKLAMFLKDQYNPQLKTHRLSGKLDGCWAFRLTYDHRVIFRFVGDNRVLLLDIGTHDQVY